MRKRSKTVSRKELLRDRRRAIRSGMDLPLLLTEEDDMRPKTRADCIDAPRPCPYASCRYHLLLDVKPKTGSLVLNFPGKDVDEIPETCALDVAAEDGVTLERVGELTNMTRERVRQIEQAIFTKRPWLMKFFAEYKD